MPRRPLPRLSRFRFPRRAVLLLFAVALVSGAGCGRKGPESPPPPSVSDNVPLPVRVAVAERTSLPRKAEFVGSLAGIDQVTVSSELEGTVESVPVDLGDPVRKGQLLATLAAEEFRFRKDQAQADLEQTAAKLGIPPDSETLDVDATSLVRRASAEFDNAKSDLDRRRTLLERNLISRKEVDDAQARYLVAEANVRAAREESNTLFASMRSRRAQLALAEKRLRDTRVLSPLNGSVEARLVSGGEYVKVGTPLLRLVNDHPIRLLGEVPETFSAELRTGLPVELLVDGHPGRTFRGTLRRISPSSNTTSRAILVEALFPNPARDLKPGFFGKATLVLRTDPDAVTVPKEAVITFSGINKVFVVAEGACRERKVELGEDLGDRVEVREGIRAGEAVAVSNTGKLVEGASVRIEAGDAK